MRMVLSRSNSSREKDGLVWVLVKRSLREKRKLLLMTVSEFLIDLNPLNFFVVVVWFVFVSCLLLWLFLNGLFQNKALGL